MSYSCDSELCAAHRLKARSCISNCAFQSRRLSLKCFIMPLCWFSRSEKAKLTVLAQGAESFWRRRAALLQLPQVTESSDKIWHTEMSQGKIFRYACWKWLHGLLFRKPRTLRSSQPQGWWRVSKMYCVLYTLPYLTLEGCKALSWTHPAPATQWLKNNKINKQYQVILLKDLLLRKTKQIVGGVACACPPPATWRGRPSEPAGKQEVFLRTWPRDRAVQTQQSLEVRVTQAVLERNKILKRFL